MTAKRKPIKFSDIFLDDEVLQNENSEIWHGKEVKKSNKKKY